MHIFPADPSQTHECGNWDCGRAIPFLGIVVSNFRYWFFAVYCHNTLYEGNLGPARPNLTETKNIEALVRQSRDVGLNCEALVLLLYYTLMYRLFFYLNILFLRDGFGKKQRTSFLT